MNEIEIELNEAGEVKNYNAVESAWLNMHEPVMPYLVLASRCWLMLDRATVRYGRALRYPVAEVWADDGERRTQVLRSRPGTGGDPQRLMLNLAVRLDAAQRERLEPIERAAAWEVAKRSHACTHAPKGEARTVAYTGSVSRDEERRAHGGVCHVFTCRCGAEKRVNTNGRYSEEGPWCPVDVDSLLAPAVCEPNSANHGRANSIATKLYRRALAAKGVRP